MTAVLYPGRSVNILLLKEKRCQRIIQFWLVSVIVSTMNSMWLTAIFFEAQQGTKNKMGKTTNSNIS